MSTRIRAPRRAFTGRGKGALGRLAGAIWPAIAIAGACTAWAGSDDPADLANLRRQRDTAMLSIRHDADAKQARLDQEYQKALDDLYRRYVTQNDLGGAAAVLKERRAVFPGAEKPAEGLPAASQKFSWPSARKGLTYRYKSRNFAKAAYDYSDRACSKLLDGQFKEHAFEGTVAWDDESVAVVCFEFTFPVKPSRFRVHVLGGMPKNGYKPPRSVVVSDGDRNTPGREIGAAQNLKDKCDWVDIDIQPTRPSQYFWVAIEKADAQLVCIDEVEFR